MQTRGPPFLCTQSSPELQSTFTVHSSALDWHENPTGERQPDVYTTHSLPPPQSESVTQLAGPLHVPRSSPHRQSVPASQSESTVHA